MTRRTDLFREALNYEARLRSEVERLTAQKDGAYAERDQVVALLARMALALGWRAGLARHVDKPGDPPWEDDWRNLVLIDLPTGQVSWHFHDSEMPFFAGLPAYPDPWDGHDTAEKYRRVAERWPWTAADVEALWRRVAEALR